MGLFELVKKRKLKQPTQRGFLLSDWQEQFDLLEEKEQRDVDLLKLVSLFDHNFSLLRTSLNKYSFPYRDTEKNLKLVVGFLNREYMVLKERGKEIGNIDEKTFSVNKLIEAKIPTIGGNEVDAEGYLSGIVECSRYLYNELLNTSYDVDHYNGDISILNFLTKRLNIAGTYNLNDTLWQKSLWLNWGVDLKNDVYCLVPREKVDFDREVVGLHRFYSLHLEATQRALSAWNNFSNIWKNELLRNCIGSVKSKDGVYSINSKDCKKSELSHSLLSSLIAEEIYWNELLVEKLPSFDNLCVREILNIWTSLSSYGDLLLEKIPSDTEVVTIDKLNRFAITINKRNLIATLSKKFKLKSSTVKKVLRLFTNTGDVRVDPWFTPLIDLNRDTFLVVISVLISGNTIRLVEYLLKVGGVSLARRGDLFEEYSYNIIKDEVMKIEYFDDQKVFSSRKIFVNGKLYEEIDLLWVFGNTMLIVEMKCSLFPTGGIDWNNYLEDLKDGAKQLKRKKKFVEEHKLKFFEELGLCAPDELNIEIVVLSNLPLGSGFPVDGVPVVDNYLLGTFIRGNQRLFALGHKTSGFYGGQIKQYHKKLSEAELNLNTYLHDPTSVKLLRDRLKYRLNLFTGLFKEDVKAEYLAGEVVVDDNAMLRASGRDKIV